MYSFYGGRPGNSFIIIKSFDTVSDMVAAFQNGPNYTDGHYDEYVIINTIDKNSADNGKIYRRGYDFQNAEGGAEYIGTIVGPSGNAPMVQMTTEADVQQKKQQYNNNPAYTQRFNQGSDTLTNHGLVPGKQGDTFHDKISWTCCSIRDTNGTDTIAYIGFTIPYPVIELQAQTGSPYSQATATKVAELEEHPFYDIDASVNGISRSICKIEIVRVRGMGFFIELEKNNRPLFCLMINEHIIKMKLL